MVDILLRVTVVLRGVSGATVVAAGASADERRFGEFPVGIIAEIVVIVWERDRGKCEINVSD